MQNESLRLNKCLIQLFNREIATKTGIFTPFRSPHLRILTLRVLHRFAQQFYVNQSNSMSDESTKHRIMLAAGPIFARKGFRATTVREICDQAEVNLASINYYFGDKQKLYNETVILAREMRVQKVPYPDWASDTSPEIKLYDFVTLLLNRLVALQTEPWQVRLLMREVLQPTEASKHLIREYFSPFFNMLLLIVDELMDDKPDDATRYKFGFSIIGQCLHYRYAASVTALMIPLESYQDEFDTEALARHITEFTLGGIERFTRQQDAQKNKVTKAAEIEKP